MLVFYLVHFSAAIFILLCRPFIVLIHSFTFLALVLVCIFLRRFIPFLVIENFLLFISTYAILFLMALCFIRLIFSLCYQVAALLRGIEALESTQKSNSVEDGHSCLGAYSLRRKCDFDKYIALSGISTSVVLHSFWRISFTFSVV